MGAEILCVLTGFGLSVPLQSPFTQAAKSVIRARVPIVPRITKAGVLRPLRPVFNLLMSGPPWSLFIDILNIRSEHYTLIANFVKVV